MSDLMGPLSYGKKDEQIFLGREFATHKDYSEETAQRIDQEITRIVTQSYERAMQLLTDHMEALHKISAELIEKEVLNAAELDAIMGIRPDDGGKDKASSEAETVAVPAVES
jgi:cell division protease FtsH